MAGSNSPNLISITVTFLLILNQTNCKGKHKKNSVNLNKSSEITSNARFSDHVFSRREALNVTKIVNS